MGIAVKKTRIALILLSIIGLTACHPASTTKNKKKTLTAPAALLDIDFNSSIIIPVTIKNKQYHFLVDTGSSINVINEKIASEITTPYPFSELPANYRLNLETISTANGPLKGHQHNYLKPIAYFIGNEEINDDEVWLSLDLTLFSQALGVDIDGLIGIPTFRKFSWQVDNLAHRLTITKDAPSSFAYQECRGYSDKQNSMPEMWFNYKNFSDISFLIDTGSYYSGISIESINYLKENHGQDIQAIDDGIGVGANGLLTPSTYILHNMIFDHLPLGNIIISENKNQKSTMGMSFLSRFDRYAFIPSRMMFCYSSDSIEEKKITPVRSIAIRYINQHIEIFYNSEEQLTTTGLMNGDIILKANGQFYAPEQIDALRKLFLHTAKGALELTIQRNGQQLTLSL